MVPNYFHQFFASFARNNVSTKKVQTSSEASRLRVKNITSFTSYLYLFRRYVIAGKACKNR
jgi:hypothetical protein